ncbi:MAG: ATP-binding protein [Marinilabiliales bacterium]|nr:ATP-binding protein [Marinilabiliales bacterium]
MKTNHMEKGKIGVTTENIFPIIKKFLYSDHEIFLRELVSNATDAIQKLKTLSSAGEFKGELGELQVKIAVDTKKKTITVSDNGIGMSAEEIDKYLNQIAFSSANEFLDRYKDQTRVCLSDISALDSIHHSWFLTRLRSYRNHTMTMCLQ